MEREQHDCPSEDDTTEQLSRLIDVNKNLENNRLASFRIDI